MKFRCLALLSGGLDSRLAIKLMQDQKIEVLALYFSLPFGSGCCMPDCAFNFAQTQHVKLEVLDCNKGKLFQEFINVIRKPAHGYGVGMNPCIDCRIFMLKKAKELMPKYRAKFIVTGEVLNERPMSQTKSRLEQIEKETGLKGKILRPLSAKLLPETIAEKKGLVDRNKLLDIQGRERKIQMALAKKYKISYPTPAGGCLLCEKEFAIKLRDLFKHKKVIKPQDILLLRLGRHFRLNKVKIIVGRNEQENSKLTELADNDLIFEVKDIPSPITILQSNKPTKKEIEIAAKLTAHYSDDKSKKVLVEYWHGKEKEKKIEVSMTDSEKLLGLRVS